jgi:hypothetical protein
VLSNIGEDVGADVEATEGVEVPDEGLIGMRGIKKKVWNIPVSLDGGDLGVVVVVVVVGGAFEVLWDSITEEDAEDAVLDGVGLVLVEGDKNKGVVHEMLIVPTVTEVSWPSEVMLGAGVSVHLNILALFELTDEQPLREFVCLEILVE